MAATDDLASTLIYRVFRDGGTSDGTNISALSPVSELITVLSAPPSFFADGFNGGFANWTSVNGLTIDAALGAPSVPSARASVIAARASASKVLGASSSVLCMSERVNLASIGSSTVSLLRLRMVGDSDLKTATVNYDDVVVDTTAG
jgi:hypothetical protein